MNPNSGISFSLFLMPFCTAMFGFGFETYPQSPWIRKKISQSQDNQSVGTINGKIYAIGGRCMFQKILL